MPENKTIMIRLGPLSNSEENAVVLPDGTDITQALSIRRVEIEADANPPDLSRATIYAQAPRAVVARLFPEGVRVVVEDERNAGALDVLAALDAWVRESTDRFSIVAREAFLDKLRQEANAYAARRKMNSWDAES